MKLSPIEDFAIFNRTRDKPVHWCPGPVDNIDHLELDTETDLRSMKGASVLQHAGQVPAETCR